MLLQLTNRKILLTVIVFLLHDEGLKRFVDAQKPCKTPEFESGYCLHYKKCPNYLEYLRTEYQKMENPYEKLTQYLKQSLCYSNTHICCDELYITAESFYDVNEWTSTFNPQGLHILSSLTECGNVSTHRIAHGTKTKRAEFPWMALIEYDTSLQSGGGSLISDRYILTAAHCLLGKEKIISVLLGAHDLDNDPEEPEIGCGRNCILPYERFGIEKIIPHPKYNKYYSLFFDIGLIKLDRPVAIQKHITPICLPLTPFSLGTKESYIIAGWGTTEFGTTSRVLQKAVVNFKSRSECRKAYRRQNLTTHVLCAGGDGLIDNCRADSGGPLFIPANYLPLRARYIQYGIISNGGTNCGSINNSPSIYTNIIEFMPWITDNIEE